jgi:hypothetical protein
LVQSYATEILTLASLKQCSIVLAWIYETCRSRQYYDLYKSSRCVEAWGYVLSLRARKWFSNFSFKHTHFATASQVWALLFIFHTSYSTVGLCPMNVDV